MTWDPDARSAPARTPRQAFAAMIQRVEAELSGTGTGAGYTPAIRAAESAYDAAPPEQTAAALAQLEDAWLVEISRARRRKARTP